MAVATDDLASWIEQADIPKSRLTPQLQALLQAVFRFRQQQGCDYYSTRLLSHFLLHCGTGLKVAQIARLLGISRPNASLHQNLSSKAAIRQDEGWHFYDGSPLTLHLIAPGGRYSTGRDRLSAMYSTDGLDGSYDIGG